MTNMIMNVDTTPSRTLLVYYYLMFDLTFTFFSIDLKNLFLSFSQIVSYSSSGNTNPAHFLPRFWDQTYIFPIYTIG